MENQTILPDHLKFTKTDWELLNNLKENVIQKVDEPYIKGVILLAVNSILQKINYRLQNEK